MSVLDLTRAGINFLAIDFDLTLVDTHTEGRWPGSPSELAARVRPNLRHLMNEAMDAGIHVAIVTLSPQVPLISAVLQLIFPASCDMVFKYFFQLLSIYICADTHSWKRRKLVLCWPGIT